MFGEQHLGDTGHDGNSRAAAMADSAEVCGCNGVKQGHDRQGDPREGPVHARRGPQAHQGQRLLRLLHRPGRADPDVHRRRRLLRRAQDQAGVRLHRRQPPGGARRDPRAAAADDRRRLRAPRTGARRTAAPPAGRRSTTTCISTWPHEAQDDPQSRFINERAHANIQKDGTYSVIPRMWGGETNARELRRIADVVDKYRIPTVKVTGGQRIDLLGREEGRPDRRSGRTSACPPAMPTARRCAR